MVEANYVSGDDYVIEFQDHRFGFNASDFEERVTAAAVKLGLVPDNGLDDEETADVRINDRYADRVAASTQSEASLAR